MRLLHTTRLTLETPTGVQPYAILSHRWLADSEEVSFQDLQHMSVSPSEGSHDNHAKSNFPPNVHIKKGLTKLQGACKQASRAGLEYIWIDTCCIDKTSSAELSEAINSMYAWYQESAVCYVYLHDVDNDAVRENPKFALENAEWFKRGWTLQELIAPDNVYFFDTDWTRIGSKATFATILNEITHIRKDVLLGNPCEPSIAEKMSWAAGRKTRKIEDRAYSLMGLFNIHMPIIYGEGEKAFKRLQLEIMKSSDDQTIFAWLDTLTQPSFVRDRGLLASTPDVFKWSAPPVVTIDHSHFINLLPTPRHRNPLDLPRGYSVSNDGIRITLPMKWDRNAWLAVLKCKKGDQEFPCGIYLIESSPGNFLRTSPTKLPTLESEDLKGLSPREICIVVDHHILPSINRKQFFTFRSTDAILEGCGYYVCPKPRSHHDIRQGSGYKALDHDTRIELSDNVQCGCIYSQGPGTEVTVLLIGVEHHRPWVHLYTDPNLHKHVDTSQARRHTVRDVPRLVTSPTSTQSYNQFDPIFPLALSSPTSIQSDNQVDPISPLTPSSRSQSLSPTSTGHNDRSIPPRRSTAPHPAQLGGGGTGCPVCSIIEKCSIDIDDIKKRRTDFATGIISDKQIEVNIRKGHTRASEVTLEVDYVITIAVSVPE